MGKITMDGYADLCVKVNRLETKRLQQLCERITKEINARKGKAEPVPAAGGGDGSN